MSRKSASERTGTARQERPVVITCIGRSSSRSSRASPSARDLRLFVCVVDLGNDLEGALSHDDLDWLSIFEFDINRQDSDSDFVKDSLPAIAAVGKRDHGLARERSPCSDNRMAGKRDLTHRRKDTQASQYLF